MSSESHSVALSASSSHGAAEAASPISSFSLRQVIRDRETELLVQTFDDRIFVVITQNGKIGCLTQATLPPVQPLNPPTSNSQTPFPPPPPTITLTPLLGSPPSPTLHALYVSQISTLVWWALDLAGKSRRPVVVGLALVGMRKEDDHGDEKEREVQDPIDNGEKERFVSVMKMIAAWPGPI